MFEKDNSFNASRTAVRGLKVNTAVAAIQRLSNENSTTAAHDCASERAITSL